MKTADLVDLHADKVSFCHLPFLKFGHRRRFAGEIATVRCFEDNGLVKLELQKPGAGRVLVVDAGGSTRTAMLGDINAAVLRDKGWAGMIVNGAIRDSAEIGEMDVGVHCLGVTPLKSSKNGVGEIGVPVTFGGVTFRPGGYVYCDEDGILVAEGKLP